VLLRIFLEQKGLFVGWHHLTSEGVSILTTGDEYGSIIDNSKNNNKVKFNSAFGESPGDPQNDMFVDLNLMTNWDQEDSDIYYARAHAFGEVLDEVVHTIRTQNAEEKYDPYLLDSEQKAAIMSRFDNFTDDLTFRNGNPFSSFLDDFPGDSNSELLEEELLAQAVDSSSPGLDWFEEMLDSSLVQDEPQGGSSMVPSNSNFSFVESFKNWTVESPKKDMNDLDFFCENVSNWPFNFSFTIFDFVNNEEIGATDDVFSLPLVPLFFRLALYTYRYRSFLLCV